MNEFTAKKLGEVLAFASVSLDTADRAENALITAFGAENLEKIKTKNTEFVESINRLAIENQVTEIVNKKLEGTGNKLKSMRDLYIGDEWDNPTELLEWSGFFLGAAIVHWDLVSGVAESLNNQTLKNLTSDALSLHRELFEITENKLKEVGGNRATG